MSSPCATAHAQSQRGCARERVSFVVVPNQSLSDRGAYMLYGALSGAVAIFQAPFLMRGYWPVTMFSVIDLLGMVFAIHAFRLCQQERREEIVVEDGAVNIRRFAFGKSVRELRLACYGLKLIRSDDPDFGCRRLAFSVRGKREEIARDLSPAERASFADVLWQSLRRYSVPLSTEMAFGWSLFTKGPYAP
ncbi:MULTISPECIES: DUF2244 domain-containing protein [unclassified Hyphomicrobium]|uniref:DUF2244 domain-containing protein n=1 Tax=unclassified Hyphomicrobium TaxID=2619925 RepID=UPI000213F430|nr:MULTISPECIES: DUF2244 domain-containing protein [unclassified Hyphomicrobium]CCB64911.1 protein of unknown function [Hyphomicrobium sp. MC1]